jgi:cytidylate kinase
MKNRIITISREFGSGGRTIGKRVAERLSIPCYDYELIETIAKESGFAKDYIAEQGEYTPYRGWFSNALSGRTAGGLSNQDQLWIMQRKLILQLAEQGSCVIVGRCADYILKDCAAADCLNVFIHAPLSYRANRIVNEYGETDLSPEKRLKDKDKRRAAYYQFYTETEWGKAQNYDLCLNSATLGLDTCVDLISSLY